MPPNSKSQPPGALNANDEWTLMDLRLQFQFRLNALEGNIPGVKKASW